MGVHIRLRSSEILSGQLVMVTWQNVVYAEVAIKYKWYEGRSLSELSQ